MADWCLYHKGASFGRAHVRSSQLYFSECPILSEHETEPINA
ncbi:hypothetical protein EGR_09005 [Echinococcus granulosus]|uniref:Uncharacterized protein n=1 Tax=Echinococcus granulosus TaxID=6210 RepID=W6U4P4_ECHGR|nr:hypothetical protein EGR_09005 [Echinococcus granulosus]EUB56113.1 hypothetical protein EGR_09005 [Echinococcus granulosus]